MITEIKFKDLESMIAHAVELEQIFSQIKARSFNYKMAMGKESYVLEIKTFKICLN